MNSSNNLNLIIAKNIKERVQGIPGVTFDTNYPDYVSSPMMNVMNGVQKEDFWNDLSKGAGSELTGEGSSPAKFCALISSSALAVNTFAPFRHHPQNLVMEKQSGFHSAAFEMPFPTGLKGTPPHLDFYIENDNTVIGIESKFTEILSTKEAKFRNVYEAKINKSADQYWQNVYSKVINNPHDFQYLDVAQLVKHYLGLNEAKIKTGKNYLLMYVYWQPLNASDIELYNIHGEEIAKLKEIVNESDIPFVAYDYLTFWRKMKTECKWEGIENHINLLFGRYGFDI